LARNSGGSEGCSPDEGHWKLYLRSLAVNTSSADRRHHLDFGFLDRSQLRSVVFNIPPGTKSLPEGAGDVKKKLMPKGAIQSRTDFGAGGYGGPCPPAGDKPHRYQVTVFAVDVDKLPDAKNDAASAALVGFDLNFHTLAKATLTGLYGR
jgi:Raf kinase inhibitor-like YbhB/YbcL family protein